MAVHLYGQPVDMDRLHALCDPRGVEVVEDAAEALGATYKGRPCGGLARFGVLSFNGNKILTTSGGGMLVCRCEEDARLARRLATQAREPAPHYEHETVGYNYRLSNVCAAIGRGQLRVLPDRAECKRALFEGYRERLAGVAELEFMPEVPFGRGNRWLTCVLFGRDDAQGFARRERVRLALEAERIESRPVWKPMHMQPVFAERSVVGGSAGRSLFLRGLCLPSGTAMTEGRSGPCLRRSAPGRSLKDSQPDPFGIEISFRAGRPGDEMGAQLKSANFYILLCLDLILAISAHLLAYLTRFEGAVPLAQWHNFYSLLPYFSTIKLACFFYFDLYRGMWRYTSLPDLFNIIRAVTTASLIMIALLLLEHRFFGFSRSVFVLDWLYTLLLVGTLRILIRLVYGVGWVQLPRFLSWGALRGARRRCVLLGAGDAAENLVRDILSRRDGDVEIVALFDDDPVKKGRLLHGLPVVGSIDRLPAWTRTEGERVQEALIAMPRLSGPGLRRVVRLCEEAGLKYKTIPSLSEIAGGAVSVKALRDVDFKDLLGREPITLETGRIAGYLEGRTVLVTGAGGSIGSELCRQILRFRPGRLLLLDANEFNLYSIQMELEHEKAFTDYEPILGTLQDPRWTRSVLDRYRPSVVFHAAAYKHVPLLEEQPWQAVWNNVLATANLVTQAIETGVERLLVVSTDKAVRPTNVMGATKRLTERIMQAHCGQGARLMAVRFGNVVGSAGSVIPLFRRQIEHGGPVTVTHPEVVRFFMTVEEASQLILQAGSMGSGGEIFVLRMGQPVKIADMAADLIRLSGKEPGRDIEIKFIGMRPGEKLYEELITEDEGVVPTEHDKIMVLRGQSCDWEDLRETVQDLADAAEAMDGERIRRRLSLALPDYRPMVVRAADLPGGTG